MKFVTVSKLHFRAEIQPERTYIKRLNNDLKIYHDGVMLYHQSKGFLYKINATFYAS